MSSERPLSIHVVLLDADGVLNDGRLLNLQEFNISHEAMQPFFSGEFKDCLVGKSDLKDVLPKHFSNWGWSGTIEELLEYWFRQGSAVDEVVRGVVEQLREHDVPVYLATDQERHRADYMRIHMGYGDLLNGIYASSEVGYKKASKEFWENVCEDLELSDRASALFWDDRNENVEVARSAGLTVHQFTAKDDFMSRMREYFPFLR